MKSRPHEGVYARAREAVGDPQLRDAVWTSTQRFLNGRNRAFEQLPQQGSPMRDLGREIRIRTLKNLDVHLERFVASCKRNGTQVHFARDAAEAARTICDLAAGKGLVIKSKSMATEEIHLNEALQKRGIEVVETDLGEWVIQLAGETPAHIIAPALHKTREQFAELIGREVGRTVSTEPENLVAEARARLRRDFVAGAVGISGVNFGVAETGTLVLVTNEGNGRLVTSGPKLHIALMGIEKLVPTLDEAFALLRILPRSAAGQKLTSNTTFISGPRRADEVDGPDEVHVVLLDNGRIDYLSTDRWESLLCIRCGACLNVCPVYKRIGGHAYGSTYQGPIGLLATPMVRPEDPEAITDLPHASSLCGACHEICPVKIDIPRMILSVRAEAVSRGWTGTKERAVFALAAAVLSRPRLYRVLVRVAGLFSRLLGATHFKALPSFLSGWTSTRDLPVVAPESFRSWWQSRKGP